MGPVTGVLIVSEDVTTATWWGAELEAAGFRVTWCPGPNAAECCPRLDGLPCGQRQAAGVAIVDVSESGESELYGGWPERSCTKVPDDGATVWVAPAGYGGTGVSLRHPSAGQVLVSAVRRAMPLGRVSASFPA